MDAVPVQGAAHRVAVDELRRGGWVVCHSCGILCPDEYNLRSMHDTGSRHKAQLERLAAAGWAGRAAGADERPLAANGGQALAPAEVVPAKCQACSWQGTSPIEIVAQFKVGC